MFSTKNVVDVTKKAVAQMIAGKYMDGTDADKNLAALDDQYIVDLGERLGINEDGEYTLTGTADIMFKALLAQVGKVVVDSRSYVASLPSLYVDPMNWGIISENVMIELSDVMIDEMWNPDGFINFSGEVRGSKTYSAQDGFDEGARIAAIEFGCYKPPISTKLFKRAKGIMVALTTAREQFFTAFRSASEFEAFLAGLYNSVENTLQVKAEIYALMTVSMGIAKAAANGNLISLRDAYNLATGTSFTGSNDALLQDEGFQKFMSMTIVNTRDYMQRYTAAYNDHEHVTFSAQPNLIMLSQAANAIKFGVRANTYNEQLIGVGEFDKVASWQAAVGTGQTTPYNLTTASSISLSQAAADEAGLEGKTTLTGVVAVLYDRMAMGITVDKKKVTTQYAASRDTVNSFYHALTNYVVNDSYPIVAFTLDSLVGA